MANQKSQSDTINQMMVHQKMLETQIAQLTTSNLSRNGNGLPDKGKAHETLNAIHLRSGTSYKSPEMPKDASYNEDEVLVEDDSEEEQLKDSQIDQLDRVKSNSTELNFDSTESGQRVEGRVEKRIPRAFDSIESSPNSIELNPDSTESAFNSTRALPISPNQVSFNPSSSKASKDVSPTISKDKGKETEPPIEIKLPFPSRQKNKKIEEQFGSFLKVVKNLEVTIPFTELIERIPSYAKFMKDIITRKRKICTIETAAFAESSSTTLRGRSPPKLDDPGSFSITCIIGNLAIQGALCDLGASVSVMPRAIAEKLNLGPLKVTKTTIQLADRSVIYPLGILEDVPVKIGNFFIPVDFIVLDIPEDSQVPIILGRPFLYTAGAVIDMRNGSLTFEVGGEKINYKVDRPSKPPAKDEYVFAISVVDKDDDAQKPPTPPSMKADDCKGEAGVCKEMAPRKGKPKVEKTREAKAPLVKTVLEWRVREGHGKSRWKKLKAKKALKVLNMVEACVGKKRGEASDDDPGDEVEATRLASGV